MRNRFFGNGEVRPGKRQYFRRSRVVETPLPPAPEKTPEVPVIGELLTEDILTTEQLPPAAAEERIQEIQPILLEPEVQQPVEKSEDILLEEQPKKKRGKQKKTSTT